MTAELVLRGGRVCDPESGFDEIADVWIRGSEIVAVGTALEVPNASELSIAGCVVGPGFIDLHSHACHTIAGQRLQALDGVTTALDLEAGSMPVALALTRAAAEGRPLNYGFSASWTLARAAAHLGKAPDARIETVLAALSEPEWQRDSTPHEMTSWLAALEAELADGALGVGVLLGYAPQSDPREFAELAKLVARSGAVAFTHVRELVEADPNTPIDGSAELVLAAETTHARMHHCHVNSSSRRHADRVLALLERARSGGVPVTMEAYPYGAGSTAVGAAFLDPDRLNVWGITPDRVVMVGSGERIADGSRLAELRRLDPGATCIVEYLDESDPQDAALLRTALAFPDSIVASDAMPLDLPGDAHDTRHWPLPAGTMTHPRTAGTFSKALRQMVRDRQDWTWLEAFRRCSLLPANLLADMAPTMRRKGRIRAGFDADLVVINPETLTDRSTLIDPIRPSTGVEHLLVRGRAVVRAGSLDVTALPGRSIRSVL